MHSVPFKAGHTTIDANRYEEANYRGIARLDEDALVLEFREHRTVMDGTGYSEEPGETREVTIPLSAIRDVRAHKGLFRSRLDIELARLGPADGIPWVSDTRIRVGIPRKEALAARDLAAEITNRKADARLRELGEGGLAG